MAGAEWLAAAGGSRIAECSLICEPPGKEISYRVSYQIRMRSLLTALLILVVAGIHSMAAHGTAFASPVAVALETHQTGATDLKIASTSVHARDAMNCCTKSQGSKGPVDGSNCPMDCLGMVAIVRMPVMRISEPAEEQSTPGYHPSVHYGTDQPPITA